MKKLILVLMAMLMMMSIVSAGFEAYYKAATSPYKMNWLNATYRMELLTGNSAVVNFNNACDVLDVSYPYDADGTVPCANIFSSTLSITLKNMAREDKTTKEAYAVRADTMGLSLAVFDVFYKTSTSPYKMNWSEGANRITVNAIEYNATFSFSESCYVSDDRSYTFDADGMVPCMKIMTPNEGITITTTPGGETITTKEAFVYIHAPCTDSDGQNAYTLGETWGIEEYTTGGTPPTAISAYQQFNDMCSAALRPGPLTGVPYIAVEAYCDGDRVKYKGINCLETETCEGGICVPLPASTRSGSCAEVTCSADQICRAGVCISRESDAGERRVERVKTKINAVGVKAAALTTKACGKTVTFTQISGKADVDKATKATKEINDLLVKAAGCKKVTLKAVPASTGKLGAATAFTTLTQNAKDWVKKIKK